MSTSWLVLLYLTIFSDIIASFIGACVLFMYRNGITTMACILLFGVFTEGMCVLFANAAGHVIVPTSQSFALWYWTGRAIRSATIWAFVMYLFKRHRDRKAPTASVAATPLH